MAGLAFMVEKMITQYFKYVNESFLEQIYSSGLGEGKGNNPDLRRWLAVTPV